MARGGMRIGEVLKLTPNDMNHRKLMLKDPKSGKEQEIIFIPQKVADRLKEYIRRILLVLGSPVYFGYQSNIVGFLKKLILKISWRYQRCKSLRYDLS